MTLAKWKKELVEFISNTLRCNLQNNPAQPKGTVSYKDDEWSKKFR